MRYQKKMLNIKQKEIEFLNELREQGGNSSYSKTQEQPKPAPLLLTESQPHNHSSFVNYKQLYENLHKDIEQFVKEHEEYTSKTSYLFKQLIDEIKNTIKVKYPKIEVCLSDKSVWIT